MRWRERLRAPRWDGTSGKPPSGNGASSFHLFWDVPDHGWTHVEAQLEVLEEPAVPRLYFWALQVGFADGRGRSGGGAHLGLQFYPPHPQSRGANWGGYAPQGGELDGSALTIPSATGNRNTGDLAWHTGRPYLLAVDRTPEPAPDGLAAWAGSVTDLHTGQKTVLRHLWAAGDRLVAPMVWSEVFAHCDEPGTAVRWSGLRLRAPGGDELEVRAVRVNYQRLDDGGCATTDSSVDTGGDGFVQRTGTSRRTAPGARLALGAPG
jgi:hypothetical protein